VGKSASLCDRTNDLDRIAATGRLMLSYDVSLPSEQTGYETTSRLKDHEGGSAMGPDLDEFGAYVSEHLRHSIPQPDRGQIDNSRGV